MYGRIKTRMDFREEDTSLGAAACFTKPYKRNELLKKISKVTTGSTH